MSSSAEAKEAKIGEMAMGPCRSTALRWWAMEIKDALKTKMWTLCASSLAEVSRLHSCHPPSSFTLDTFAIGKWQGYTINSKALRKDGERKRVADEGRDGGQESQSAGNIETL